MSQLELRNLATDESVIVPSGGFTFGREGGDADIQLDDKTIARRQARVGLRQGQWVLETLAVAAGARPPRPQALAEGMTFAVGETEFEVTAAIVDDDDPVDDAPPTAGRPVQRPSAAALPPAAKPKPKPGPPVPTGVQPKAPAPSKPAPRTASKADADDDAEGSSADAPSGGIKGLFVGVPKGIAYYLVNVPKLLLNPLGTVRSTIEKQPSPALGTTDLIGYGVPSMVATTVVGAVAAIIASAIRGAFALDIVGLIISIAVGVVVAVVTGFVWHPVTKWVIDKLQGQSTAKSRSNYFLQFQTLAIVLALPNALGTVLSSIRFLNLIGVLLLAVASLVGVFVNYKWLEHFGVVKWLLTVMKVLAVLVLLGGLANFGSALMTSIRGGGGVAGSSAAGTNDAVAALEKANEEREKAEKLVNEAQGKGLDEQKKAGEKLAAANSKVNEASDLAFEAAKGAAAQPPAAEVKDAKDVKDAKEPSKPVKPSEPIAEVPDTKKPSTPKEEVKAVEPARTPPPPTPSEDTESARPSGPQVASAAKYSAFSAFAQRRASVEATLAADPTIFNKKPKLKALYGAYLTEVTRIEKNSAKERAKHLDQAQLYEYLKQAELFSTLDDKLKEIAQVLDLP